MLLKPPSSKSIHILSNHHKLGHLAHAKNIQNLQTYFIYMPTGTHATPILVISGQVAGFGPLLCQTGLEILTFSFVSIFFGPRHNYGYPGQTWSSVNPLDHKKAYKTVPLQILVSVRLTQQYYSISYPVELISRQKI